MFGEVIRRYKEAMARYAFPHDRRPAHNRVFGGDRLNDANEPAPYQG